MILTCPQCSTRYQADAAKFPPTGRNVKCSKCGHQWLQVPPPPEPEIVIAPAPVPTAEVATPSVPEFHPEASGFSDGAPPATRRSPRNLGVWAGWAGLALFLIFTLGGFFFFRSAILAHWPQAASLYRAVGFPMNVSGIQLAGVTNHLETENGEHVLEISGRLVNTSGREQVVPQIRIALTDSERHELTHWPVLPSVPVLKPGQSAPFRARFPHPPSAMQDVEVTFYRSGE